MKLLWNPKLSLWINGGLDMDQIRYDLIFLGGGPAGYQGAIRAAQLGLKVAVVENRDVGGVCLNRGCIPTKTIKASADLLAKTRQAKTYGISIENARPDITAIIARKNKVVALLRGGVEQLFRANHITLYRGTGYFRDPQTIMVQTDNGEVRLSAPKMVIVTGSRPRLPGPFTAISSKIWTSDEILEMQYIPERLAIVGAGVVGIEMAFIMSALGSEVTLIESSGIILPGEDQEMVAYLMRMLKRQKIKLLTCVSVDSYVEDHDVSLLLSNSQEIKVNAVLLAAGRIANIETIGLAEIGLTPINGYLIVDEHMQTFIPGIYAAGDVIGGWLLAHVAFAEGIVAAENAAGLNSTMDYTAIPRCIYGMPEFASVGLSEEEARQNYRIKAVTFPLKTLGMAQALGEWEGMLKLIVEESEGSILGGHIIGAHATDLIAEITLAMINKISVEGLVKTIHAHPSMAESVLEVAQAALGQAIHMLP